MDSFFSKRTFQAILLCFALAACENGGTWNKPETPCDPATKPILQQSERWKTTFGDKGSTACLRLSWGLQRPGAIGRYVKVSPDGRVQAYEPQEGSFTAPVTFTLPAESRDQTRTFTLFVFGQGVPSARQERHCLDVMGTSAYTCVPNERGTCWFAIQFQPKQTSTTLRQSTVAGGCQWTLPPPQPSPEPTPEPMDAGQEVTSPDLSPQETTMDTPDETTTDASQARKQEPRTENTPDANDAGTTDALPDKAPPETSQQLSWAKSIGSKDDDHITGVASDANGNVYITGQFSGTMELGKFRITSRGRTDIFVAKLDPTGLPIWVRQAGGRSNDFGRQITVDAKGRVYITANTSGTGTFGTTPTSSTRYPDLVIAGLSPQGAWLWALQANGAEPHSPAGITTDAKGAIYVAGHFEQQITFGTNVLRANGEYDGFVVKINTQGTLQWVKKYGSTKRDSVAGIASDQRGHLYIAGHFQDTMTLGNTTLKSRGAQDIFLGKMDTQGLWQWAKRAGSTVTDFAYGVAVDTAGHPHITGNFQGTADFGKHTAKATGGVDIFVSKLNDKGNFLWVSRAGGAKWDDPRSIAVDGQGNVYITGFFSDSIEFGTKTFQSKGDKDIFVAKLDNQGKWLLSDIAGGAKHEYADDITANTTGNVYVVGRLSGTGTFGGTLLTTNGNSDGFLWKVDLRP